MSNISEEDKLSWGDVDFIEESASFCNEPLDFQELDESAICEAEVKKSPFKIIGKLVGKFAPVGGFSRNNRYYPESHWRGVLESAEVQRRLKGREMLGMIGHEDARVGDNQIRAGLISHIVSCLEIREDKSGKPFLYGEMDILDTPAGRILKAMHEGGAGLYVSSRAAGKLLDTPGKPYKTVAPQFFLETWDVVARPGFIEAKPVYEEVTNESITEENINELDNKTVESDLKKREDQLADAEAHAKENPKAAEEAKKKFENAVDSAQKRAERNDEILDQDSKGNFVHYKNESEEIAELNNKISQLTKIIEKVVNDVYEEETSEKVEVKSEKKEDEKADKKAALPAFIKIMAESNISEEAFSEILDMIKGDIQ